MLPEWREGLERKCAGRRGVGVDCTGGTVAAVLVLVVVLVAAVVLVVLALVVGVVHGDSGGKGRAWLGWGASFLLLLAALAQLDKQRVGSKVNAD